MSEIGTDLCQIALNMREKRSSQSVEPMFQVRDSPFTTAMRDPNHRATFSLLLTVQIFLFSASCVHYFFNRRQLRSDWNLFVHMFSPIEAALLLEAACTAAMILLLPVVRMNKSVFRSILYPVTKFSVILIILFVPIYLKIKFDTHPVLSCGMCMQQIRFFMKIVSFISENRLAREDNNNNSHDMEESRTKDVERQDECDSHQKPTFKSMMYFLFAPTVIYRHAYPRSPTPTDWPRVLCYMCQWFLLFMPATLAINRQFLPICRIIGLRPLTPDLMYAGFLWMIFGSALLWLGIGYCFLHCWLNAWAEVLGFGDRMFYRNWWSASNGLTAWSMWNFMIHRWISRYVFVPCITRSNSRPLALIYTFAVSAFFHDYLISFAVGFPFPYLTAIVILLIIPLTPVIFLINYLSKLIPMPPTNIHVFVGAILSIALGMIICSLEYNSRINCDIQFDSSWKRIIIPHSFSCVTFDWRYD